MRLTWTSRWKPGEAVPPFTATLHDGTTISADSLRGKKYILFFYNHDGSATCTNEACNIRDNFSLLSEKGFIVFGVSEDSMKKHQKFIEKYQLPYPLITDQDNVLAKVFDIYGKKEFMGRISDAVHRTTFVVDTDGIILVVIHPVDSSRHSDQIIKALMETGSK